MKFNSTAKEQSLSPQPAARAKSQPVIGADQLGFWNRQLRFVVEPGAFQVMVGSNSESTIETKFEVVK